MGRKPRKIPTWRTPQLAAAEKEKASGKVPPHSLIHYLYRLRIKTNYEDSGMFTDGPSDWHTSSQVHRNIRYLASATLLVNELRIGPLVGAWRLRRWANTWLAKNAPPTMSDIALMVRRELL